MNKNDFYKKLNSNEKLNTVIYVASSYPNEKGLAECNLQFEKCKKFMEKNPNLVLVEDAFIDSAVAVRSFDARMPWFEFRYCIDNKNIDVILISDFKDACCRVGGYIEMISFLNDSSTVVYSIQEDKIYDAELLKKMKDAFYNAANSNDFGQIDLLHFLLNKMKEDDLNNELMHLEKTRIKFLRDTEM